MAKTIDCRRHVNNECVPPNIIPAQAGIHCFKVLSVRKGRRSNALLS